VAFSDKVSSSPRVPFVVDPIVWLPTGAVELVIVAVLASVVFLIVTVLVTVVAEFAGADSKTCW